MRRKKGIYKIDEKLFVQYYSRYWHLYIENRRITFPLRGYYEIAKEDIREFLFLLYMPYTEFLEKESLKADESKIISKELLPLIEGAIKRNYRFIINTYVTNRSHQPPESYFKDKNNE